MTVSTASNATASNTVASDAVAAIGILTSFPQLSACGITMTAIAPDSNGTLQGFEIALTKGAAAEVGAPIIKTIEVLKDAALLQYAPAALVPPQHWMFVKTSDAASLDAAESLVSVSNHPPFNSSATVVQYLAVRVTDSSNRSITFYRISEPVTGFKRGKTLGLVLRSGLWGVLKKENLLMLKPLFDVVVIDGIAFFVSKSAFESAFEFRAELQRQSRQTFADVTANLQIEGMADFEKACTTHVHMMAKMSSIKRSMDADPAYASAMTTANLVMYIQTHQHVNIDIVGSGANQKLVFDPSPSRRFQIVKLLDDDFLRSTLTSKEYEANSKTST